MPEGAPQKDRPLDKGTILLRKRFFEFFNFKTFLTYTFIIGLIELKIPAVVQISLSYRKI